MALRALRTILIGAVVFLSGCKSCDLVEAELRHQTARVERLEAELQQKDAEILALQATAGGHDYRHDPASDIPGPAETNFRLLGVSAIAIGPTSGAKDLDRDGATDAILLAVCPKDADGDVAKAPGSIVVELFEIGPNGVKKLVAIWEVDEAKLRKAWRSSLLGAGYQLTIPWQRRPASPTVRAVVHFRTVDGREFEAEKDFQIQLAPKPRPGEHLPDAPIVLPPSQPTTYSEPARFVEPRPIRSAYRRPQRDDVEVKPAVLKKERDDFFPWPQR